MCPVLAPLGRERKGLAIAKRSSADLAILGGPPAFLEPLHVGRPNIGDRRRLQSRIDGALDRRWLTNNGPLVRELEERLSQILEVPHTVATANNTLALQIVAQALELSGEVILPSFTFVATAHAFRWLGLRPVFCDIDPTSHNLNPQQVEELISPETSAIVGVHVWGRPCDVDALESLARKYDLPLFFDAAHAFAATHRSKPIGGFGNAEVFSFHATKFVNAFEGGAITTHDSDLAERLRLARNFGFETMDRVVALGTNAKMAEVAAAMALTSMDSVDEFISINRRHYETYSEVLRGIPGVEPVTYDDTERHNYQYVVLEIDEARAGLTRDDLLEVLHQERILARRYFYPGVHRMEPYRSEDPHVGGRLPVTEVLSQRVLSLPTGTSLTADEVMQVCEVIRIAVKDAPAVAARLAELRAKGALRWS